MPVAHHREREVTFDVDADWAVPDLAPLVPDGGRVASATHTLAATYYDTERSSLRLLGLTLRHREGGKDAGWHLKIPAQGARTEVHSQARAGTLPAALRRRVAGLVGDERVRPVATIRTTRHTHQVLTSDGELVLEVADDQVTGARPDDSAPVQWREVEVELGAAGTEKDLDRVVDLFSGARPATVQRKINHVLGEPAQPDVAGVAGLLGDYLREQCQAVLVGEVRIRDEPHPEAVHKVRVAVRRLRSTLRLFDYALTDVPDGFEEELRWFAGLLSPVRDVDILGRRLESELDDLRPQDVVGPLRDEVRRALRDRRDAGLRELQAAWDEPRYRGVLSTLLRWYASPPVPADARVRPRKVLKKARRKVERRLQHASDAEGLHSARKAAKRLRYAADLLEQQVPSAAGTAAWAKRLQTTLGDHQDLSVAEDFLRAVAESGLVQNGFSYGVLSARLQRQAKEIRSSVLDR